MIQRAKNKFNPVFNLRCSKMSLLNEERRAMNLQIETLKKQLEETKRNSSFEKHKRGREILKMQKEIAVKRSADRFQEKKELREHHNIKRTFERATKR